MALYKKKIKLFGIYQNLSDPKHGGLFCYGRLRQNIFYNTCSQSTLSAKALFTLYIKKKKKNTRKLNNNYNTKTTNQI